MSYFKNIIRSVLQFALVSSTGLCIDFAIFLSLTAASLTPFLANLVSGACAVAFVYFASVRRIFSYGGSFLLGLFTIYLAYQAAGVTLSSLAVAWLVNNSFSPVLAKAAILPVTFSTNYGFMWLLTRRGRADARRECRHG